MQPFEVLVYSKETDETIEPSDLVGFSPPTIRFGMTAEEVERDIIVELTKRDIPFRDYVIAIRPFLNGAWWTERK